MSLAYFGARAVYRAIVKKRRRVLGDLFGKVFAEVEACSVDEGPPPGDGPP